MPIALPRQFPIALFTALLGSAFFSAPSHSFTISLSNADFGLTPIFSNVQNFSFELEIDETLQHRAYTNPAISGVDYSVSGTLVAGTPSNFPGFLLRRPEAGNPPFPGTEFYAQGSSLQFEIAAGADLSDGVQIADLAVLSDFTLPSLIDPDPLLSAVTGSLNPVLVFNGREIQDVTGFSRFHPALLVLNADGTGSIRNSNNIVNRNGFDEIAFGSEYITNLTFDPATTTLSTATAQAPAPHGLLLFGAGLLLLPRLHSRRQLQVAQAKSN